MSLLTEISELLQRGKAAEVKDVVQKALDEGTEARAILEEGRLHGMGVNGGKFKNNEVYVPEVLIAARAMNAGGGRRAPRPLPNHGGRRPGDGEFLQQRGSGLLRTRRLERGRCPGGALRREAGGIDAPWCELICSSVPVKVVEASEDQPGLR